MPICLISVTHYVIERRAIYHMYLEYQITAYMHLISRDFNTKM